MLTTVKTILAADWAAAGTITVGFPAGVEGGHLSPYDHKITVKNGANLVQGRDFALTTVNKASAVLTLAAGMGTILAGNELYVEFHLKGDRFDIDPTTIGGNTLGNRTSRRQVIEVNFGVPATAAATGVTSAQILGSATNLVLDGATVVNGVAVLDVPRNITLTVATTNQSGINFTVYGTDEYGVALIETLAGPNANTVQGNKAFKRITRVASSAAVPTNGVSVGYGNKLGFPVFLGNSVDVLYDKENDATITDGTYVAGVLTKPTAATGDIRGTFTPNSASDGAKRFGVVLLTDDPTYLGAPQFAG